MRRNIRKIDKAVSAAQEKASHTGERVDFVRIIDELAEADDESFRRCYAVLRSKLSGAEATGDTSTEDVILGMLPRCVASAIANRPGGMASSSGTGGGGGAGAAAAGAAAGDSGSASGSGKLSSKGAAAAARRGKRPRSLPSRAGGITPLNLEELSPGRLSAVPGGGHFHVPLVPAHMAAAAVPSSLGAAHGLRVPSMQAQAAHGKLAHMGMPSSSAMGQAAAAGPGGAGPSPAAQRHMLSGHYSAMSPGAAMQGTMMMDARRAAAESAGLGAFAVRMGTPSGMHLHPGYGPFGHYASYPAISSAPASASTPHGIAPSSACIPTPQQHPAYGQHAAFQQQQQLQMQLHHHQQQQHHHMQQQQAARQQHMQQQQQQRQQEGPSPKRPRPAAQPSATNGGAGGVAGSGSEAMASSAPGAVRESDRSLHALASSAMAAAASAGMPSVTAGPAQPPHPASSPGYHPFSFMSPLGNVHGSGGAFALPGPTPSATAGMAPPTPFPPHSHQAATSSADAQYHYQQHLPQFQYQHTHHLSDGTAATGPASAPMGGPYHPHGGPSQSGQPGASAWEDEERDDDGAPRRSARLRGRPTLSVNTGADGTGAGIGMGPAGVGLGTGLASASSIPASAREALGLTTDGRMPSLYGGGVYRPDGAFGAPSPHGAHAVHMPGSATGMGGYRMVHPAFPSSSARHHSGLFLAPHSSVGADGVGGPFPIHPGLGPGSATGPGPGSAIFLVSPSGAISPAGALVRHHGGAGGQSAMRPFSAVSAASPANEPFFADPGPELAVQSASSPRQPGPSPGHAPQPAGAKPPTPIGGGVGQPPAQPSAANGGHGSHQPPRHASGIVAANPSPRGPGHGPGHGSTPSPPAPGSAATGAAAGSSGPALAPPRRTAASSPLGLLGEAAALSAGGPRSAGQPGSSPAPPFAARADSRAPQPSPVPLPAGVDA